MVVTVRAEMLPKSASKAAPEVLVAPLSSVALAAVIMPQMAWPPPPIRVPVAVVAAPALAHRISVEQADRLAAIAERSSPRRRRLIPMRSEPAVQRALPLLVAIMAVLVLPASSS